jgi:sugar phosphate isomerase/epimerase
MTASTKPVLGAALALDTLELHREWIIASQRDLELQAFFKAEVLDNDGWRDAAQHAKRLLDGYAGRLGVHGPFWGFKIDSQDPAIRPIVTKRLLQGLEACEAVGATQMVIHSPFTTWEYYNHPAMPGEREKQFERVHLTLRPVVARAEAIGCTLVIENIEDKDPGFRVALSESFASPSVKVSLDTGHAHYAHVSTGAPPVDVYVNAAGNMLEHVHIQDSEGYADRHWLPGQGTIRWHAVFAALGRLTSQPRLIIEVKDQVNLRRGADHLINLGLAV